MSDTPNEWTLQGFVEHFDRVHRTMLDHKYAWVLGAGASFASGIPLGSDLVDRWLAELHLKIDHRRLPLEKWATEKNLGIAKFDYEDRANFYTKVYERRFRNYPDEGYAYLESVMANADPSPGYSILAAALAADSPRHNAVVTTNFDNLVADALSIYTDTFPFVCGHESLTPFVKVAMRRPLVCKIHRDLLLAPKNDPQSLKRLHDAWETALRSLFEHYTPLFIGYGGNDDTLMDLLQSLKPGDIKGQLIWCYYEGGKPSERIKQVVAYHRGVLVPVPDFDLLMVLLGEKMGIQLMDEEIRLRADERTGRYRKRILQIDTVGHPEVKNALSASFERSGGWLAWAWKAQTETDPIRRQDVYKQGIEHYPNSAPLHGDFANFMMNVRSDYDEAEQLYRKVLELDPEYAIGTGNFALFLTDVRGDHERAEPLFRRAIELDPRNASNTRNFAFFLHTVRGDMDDAERFYRRALELDSTNAKTTGNFANFMYTVRGIYDEAETLYCRALELDPNNAPATGNFAQFLYTVRGNNDGAERLFRKALKLDAKNAVVVGNFAVFMTDVQGKHAEAEQLYCRAVELDPKNVSNLANYAAFLLAQGRLEESMAKLDDAKASNEGRKNQLSAAIALFSAIIFISKGNNDTRDLEVVRRLLKVGFSRVQGSLKRELKYAKENISETDYLLYAALGDAIVDVQKVPAALRLFDERLSAQPASRRRTTKQRRTAAPKKTTKKKAKAASKKRADDV